jgi:hypothetical protein
MESSIEHKLKDRLREAQESGKLTLRSSDLGSAKPTTPAGGISLGPVTTQVPPAANNDPLINSAIQSGGKALTDAGAAVDGVIKESNPSDIASTLLGDDMQVTITDVDRNAFLDALVSGERYIRKFSLFDGRIKGKLRCRSTEESEAVAAWFNHGLREAKWKSPLEYAIALRNGLLAAQVFELNGVRFPTLPAPLYRTPDPASPDKYIDPGWLAAAASWSQKPEPVVAALYEELRRFERTYWTMVYNATDQNFWHPAEST